MWVLDFADRALSRITSKGDAHDPVWTPDGRRVTYLSLGTPGGPIFTTSADGAGDERAIALPGRVVHPGQWLAYTSDETGRRQVYVRPLRGDGGRTLVSEAVGDKPVRSRDGQNHANSDVARDGRLIFVEPLAGGRLLMVSDWVPPARSTAR